VEERRSPLGESCWSARRLRRESHLSKLSHLSNARPGGYCPSRYDQTYCPIMARNLLSNRQFPLPREERHLFSGFFGQKMAFFDPNFVKKPPKTTHSSALSAPSISDMVSTLRRGWLLRQVLARTAATGTEISFKSQPSSADKSIRGSVSQGGGTAIGFRLCFSTFNFRLPSFAFRLSGFAFQFSLLIQRGSRQAGIGLMVYSSSADKSIRGSVSRGGRQHFDRRISSDLPPFSISQFRLCGPTHKA
jgi:hypothetical protein